MPIRAVPMFHVPDVHATVQWYSSVLGFKVIDEGKIENEVVFAMLSYGDSYLMLSSGGKPSSAVRREVDLYVYVENVDELFARIQDRVEVVEGLNDTFYGMREFIIRDLNRFWITFGHSLQRS